METYGVPTLLMAKVRHQTSSVFAFSNPNHIPGTKEAAHTFRMAKIFLNSLMGTLFLFLVLARECGFSHYASQIFLLKGVLRLVSAV